MSTILEAIAGLLELSFELGYLVYDIFDKKNKNEVVKTDRLLISLLGIFIFGLAIFFVLLIVFSVL